MDYNFGMITVAETASYLRDAESQLPAADRFAIVEFLAQRQKAGVLIAGAGGIRKLRRAKPGRGKLGGVRVVYYFHSDEMPLYLLALFAKNERANLSPSERNDLAKLADVLVQKWFERS